MSWYGLLTTGGTFLLPVKSICLFNFFCLVLKTLWPFWPYKVCHDMDFWPRLVLYCCLSSQYACLILYFYFPVSQTLWPFWAFKVCHDMEGGYLTRVATLLLPVKSICLLNTLFLIPCVPDFMAFLAIWGLCAFCSIFLVATV